MGMVFIPEEALGADSLSVGITQERNWDTFPTPGHPTYKDVASYYRGQTGTRLFSHILDPQQPSQQRTKAVTCDSEFSEARTGEGLTRSR